ncbi:MAG: radical SAM protein [Thermodesulfobacteriota bacterium]|nr:radical SAM protein [Thermodesulfobacteriota bacterium]
MLKGIHFILTYTCNFECDHCFLYCSPKTSGTFTMGQVAAVLDEAERIGTVERVFFEGGEPFLFFPLLTESIKRASMKGFKVGVVTNAYGAHSEEDAELWLRPLKEAGLSSLSISNDVFHYGEQRENPATMASSVARRLGIQASTICIEPPKVLPPDTTEEGKGRPVVSGGAKFRGRAVDKLTQGLPLRPWDGLCECPYEDLETPSRVHVDPFGHVHICQGISMGNMWTTPLSELVRNYDPERHPICGPLLRGGPAALAKALGVTHEAGCVDECHFCSLVRRAVTDRFPEYLAPKQVYGLS